MNSSVGFAVRVPSNVISRALFRSQTRDLWIATALTRRVVLTAESIVPSSRRSIARFGARIDRFIQGATEIWVLTGMRKAVRAALSRQLPTRLKKKMEEEKKTNMSKKEANKYMRFLIKEWSTAENEVGLLFRLHAVEGAS